MGALVRFDMNFPYQSGVPKDTAINTWHVYWPDATDLEVDIPTVSANIVQFYALEIDGVAVQDFMSGFIDRTRIWQDITLVDFWDTAPTYIPLSSVDYGGSFTAAPAGTNLPLEVACCVSWLGHVGEEIPDTTGPPPLERNRRGRTYVGPLTSDAIDLSADNSVRPMFNSGFMLALVKAADDYLSSLASLHSPESLFPVVWSRVNSQLSIIRGGHVNNEPDTQRRRGSSETLREYFPLP